MSRRTIDFLLAGAVEEESPVNNPDGNILFAQAVLSVAKGEKPRDGGQRLAAFADWLIERFEDGDRSVMVSDPDVSGFALVVMRWAGDEYPFRCSLVWETNHSFEPFEVLGAEGPREASFRMWLAQAAAEMWRREV